IDELLQKNAVSKEQIDGFAAASGPGSFTGLRVGLAAIKALAEILQKPIAAISMLEACAAQAEAEGNVAALLDAGRNEVFVGEYRAGKKLREFLIPSEQLSALGSGGFLCSPNEIVITAAKQQGITV